MSGPCGPKPSPHSCSVFLLDQNELVAKVFDGGVVEDEVSQGRGPGVCGHGRGVWVSSGGTGEQAGQSMVCSVSGH